MGPLPAWDAALERVAALGFSAVLVAPPFAPGRSGNLFHAADHDRPHPVLVSGDAGAGDADALLASLASAARARGLDLFLDLVLDRVAADGRLAAERPGWFDSPAGGGLPDPRRVSLEQGVLRPRLEDPAVEAAYGAWWEDRLRRWAAAGVAGFRCDAPHRVPAALWRRLTAALPGARFIAWTPSVPAPEAAALADAGFAATCDSLAWWDFRAAWLAEEAARLAMVAPALSVPEAPFGPRVAACHEEAGAAERAARRQLRAAAALGSGAGWIVPMGMEYGARRPLDPARDRPGDWDWLRRNAAFDLGEELRACNARLAAAPALAGRSGELRMLSGAEAPVVALLRAAGPDARLAGAATLLLANPDLHAGATAVLATLLPGAGGAFGPFRADWPRGEAALGPDAEIVLAPGEAKILLAPRSAPIRPAAAVPAAAAAARALPRLAIEAVSPAVDDGRFAVKRTVGEVVEVEADLVCDGHDRLAAALLWRPGDEAEWREVRMRPLGNDRWGARFPLERVGRHLFCVEAWRDVFASFRDELEKKHAAGLNIALELEEGRLLIARAAERAGGELAQLAARLRAAPEPERLTLLLSEDTAALMRAADERPFRSRSAEYPVEADRTQARFASWYELFPRSQSGDPKRHGTFDDVIRQLPRIRAMGFDVLYFPPIHPIGRVNRKGRNNSLVAEPGDPGSPYAIGSEEGGHDAIHPELGTLQDFRRLRDAAHAHGMELALDFAIQAAPDHPWLRRHREWFAWRPDGSLRYAENPPKKYEDIVNVEFYGDGAVPSLWVALRDVVRFWVEQGVRTFRVDNPHTKPLPFWEWLIADIRAEHPDCIFLSEAFTRPKMMYRLAKIGFSQSYTYFTWRNHKREIEDYLTELTETAPKDFFRPNFFVNTPDINPYFLQTSGRPGFLIRAALATTLSGLWGMYNGFELCEGRAIPGKEEYLDSEKYEIRAWDWDRPGNIATEIARLNAIRRANPALQTHLGLAFHNAFNDSVLWYRKATPDRSNVVLVAVSLDPHAVQEAAVELPLWEWGLPDHAALAAEDLMRGHRFTWRGKVQRLRLDPHELPFGIWRVRPAEGG
ncbi:alpha-1,4-glucan:maltose-1-phosphate maltosyltransferase [Caldovatus sediminis]|uniref:Alpha-1,4-glucan:maltose-1-phosphate maltosyltransferase n=1 Tax=Caldovatus sediminis TaxID=2041189 RepID=A0A8J2ZBD7_9PROT|nr:alpha-1,4-glucan--maltose-1-phosphate maltosyltransferase [Caldovatus sediminis]GGG35781.1 alpha-1,4-glucan:maltose-1-phosphate maltosyltransferase [Caldovatus sediminis]